MHKMNYDIVLINPKSILFDNIKVPIIGLCAIEAYLIKYGYRCCIISFSEIDQYIDQAEVFGISVMDQSYGEAQVLTQKLIDKTVIWGGWTATALPDYILNENEGVDYIVLQEGEYRLRQLLKAINSPEALANIDGIAYRGSDQKIHINPPKKFVDMNELPIPITMPILNKLVFIEVSRGCYGRCRYCQEVSKMRFKKADKVVDEIDHWYQKGRRNFYLGNANSMANARLLEQIIDLMEEKKQYINIYLVGRPENVISNEHVLKKIFKSQCIHLKAIEIGIEANTQNMLDILGRNLTPKSNRMAIELLMTLKKKQSPNTQIYANMILFSHFDMTMEDLIENVRFIGDYQCSRQVLSLQLYGMAKTPIWEEMQRRGFQTNPQFGLQISQYPFSNKLVNQFYEKLVKRPLDTITKQKGFSPKSHFDFNETCHDKLLDFYRAPDMLESIMNFIR